VFVDIFSTQEQYDLIYIDPPWGQQKGGLRACRPSQTRILDYSTMSLLEIEKLNNQVLSLATVNHNVFMWTIEKFLPQTEKMMKNAGYKLHARMIWDKTNGVAPAFTVRYSHEYLLWFYKPGNILMPQRAVRGKYCTVFREAATQHSRKPVFVYEMLEDMFPDAKKIEIFARNSRLGWDNWGNQVTLFD